MMRWAAAFYLVLLLLVLIGLGIAGLSKEAILAFFIIAMVTPIALGALGSLALFAREIFTWEARRTRKGECPRCRGLGSSWTDAEGEDCWGCGGTGKREESRWEKGDRR
jgi:hypothetical protein